MVAILVLATVVTFLLIDFIVQRAQAKKVAQLAVTRTAQAPTVLPLRAESFALPAGLFFSRGHTWAKLESSGNVRVGIDDFVRKLLGRFDAITLRRTGEEVKKGEPVLSIRQGKRTVSLMAPLGGVITSVNPTVAEDPQILKGDPYKGGWIYSLRPKNLARDVKGLSIAEEATTWLQNEVRRLRDFLTSIPLQPSLVGQTLQDGGLPVDGLLERMDDASLKRFEQEFLKLDKGAA